MNRYDINLKEYKDKKPIGHYDIMLTNCCYHVINFVDIVYKYGDTIAIYYPESSTKNIEKTLHYARIKENNCLNIIDANKKTRCISFNKVLRY